MRGRGPTTDVRTRSPTRRRRMPDLRCEERGDAMQAVAIGVGGHQLQDDELASLLHRQVDTQTEASGG